MRISSIAFLSLLIFVGCAHSVHEVHVSDFKGLNGYKKIEQGSIVQGKAEQFVIMGFVYDTNYVNIAKNNLITQCPQGEITGITTQYSTSLSFFSWTNKVLMQGLCVK